MTTLAVTPISSVLCHAFTSLRIGPKLRRIRSTYSRRAEQHRVFCEHRRERAIEGDVLMQIGIISDLGTTPRNPVALRVDGSSARRAGMRSRKRASGRLFGA